jgi:glucose/mannose-6-phosphate isomerase
MTPFEKNLRHFESQLSGRNIKTVNFKKLETTKPDAVVVCGMGGSGLAGDIVREHAATLGIPVPVVTLKNDGLLPLPFKRPFYICISFSGNTEETVHCLIEALKTKKKSGIAIVTGKGGAIRKIAEKKTLPAAYFNPGDLTPREASGMMYYGIASVLQAIFPAVAVQDLSRTIKAARFSVRGTSLAQKLKGKNILVYSDEVHAALGYIWKISFNETGKNAAFWNTYPEINHNEIVGFENIKGSWFALWLTDPALERKNKNKIKFVAQKLKRRGIESAIIPLEGRNEEEKFWNGVIFAWWTALGLAKKNGVAPEETKIIDELKKRFQ